jgi:glutaredoxin
MKVEIYGAEWCGFCKQAVSLCETLAISFDYIDIDDTSNMRKLEERVGSQVRTVPQIFMNDVHMPGGFTALHAELSKTA